VHHVPSGPPLSTRLVGTVTRCARRLRLRRGLVPVVLVAGVVAAVAVAVPAFGPVASFADSATAVDLESSSQSSAASGQPAGQRGPRSGVVEWGRDGTGGSPSAPAVGPTPSSPGSTTPAPSAGSPSPSPSASSFPAASVPSTAVASGTAGAPSSSARRTGAATPAPAVPAPADTSAEGRVLALMNQQRASAGCGALVADAGLAGLARAHSADMRDRKFFDHTNPDGLSPFDRGAAAGVPVRAENIAFGQPDAAAVMADWMNSSGHRANILDCRYTKLGVGVAYGSGGPWWTQTFA
jgi:uncharacterized protein YkwD